MKDSRWALSQIHFISGASVAFTLFILFGIPFFLSVDAMAPPKQGIDLVGR